MASAKSKENAERNLETKIKAKFAGKTETRKLYDACCADVTHVRLYEEVNSRPNRGIGSEVDTQVASGTGAIGG